MLTYHFDSQLKTPLYEQLYRAIRRDIESGQLVGEEKLPSKRQLAAHLQVSQVTVETAYAQLLAEGYLFSLPRKGYFVQPLPIAPQPAHPPKAIAAPSPPKALTFDYDFKTNIVDTACFPFSTWAKLSRNTLSEYADRLLGSVSPLGAPELREQIRRYLYTYRGLDVSADCILVGAGSEYLLHLLIHLIGSDRTYALENPGYPKLTQIFRNNGARVQMLPLDESGLSLRALRQSDASVVYLTPAHHFPLGLVMPAARRTALIEWANAVPGRYLIEDDYDSEFRYSSRPIPALSELDHNERVIYINTFAKSLTPSMRTGYLVLPRCLMERYRQAFSLYASTVPLQQQYTIASFMAGGGLERHISRSRKQYLLRRDALLRALKTNFTDIPYQVSGADAGLHLLLQVQNGQEEQTLIRTAADHGVRVYGLSAYYAPPMQAPASTLVLGYAGMTEAQITAAVERLRDAWMK